MNYTRFTLYASYDGPFNSERISELVSRRVDGATITFSKGLWHGEWEHSFQVHILLKTDRATIRGSVFNLAEELCKELRQSEVWIEQYQTTVTKVTA